jgi:hypothetical protein
MDIDIEISNLGLEHINKIYYIEGDCLFDAIAHLLKYLKKEKRKKSHVMFTILLWKY